jgi:cytochrome c-type biogenesis protein CcmH/NrfG
LASVASIGANHDANAIALLELAKLTDPNNFESRLALGLLYMEVKNVEAALIQFSKIGDSNFISKYFTFFIDKE